MMLGHFHLGDLLGSGGMGEVYRARDTKLDRDVALKLLPGIVSADPERHARFQREARAMAAFSHPHVAAVHALGEHEGRPFLVMELVDGETLAAVLARGPLPCDRALVLARQVAAGIEAAHAAGIVHRDLKPANIMLTTGGDVKILDFGLAKVFADDGESGSGLGEATLTSDRTRVGVVLGTAAYMSPEQARGGAVDRRADIWAFGAVLFEMISGQRAFAGATVTDTLAAVLRADPDWAALPGDVPAPVGRLLHRCLQKDPRRRLHDIADARIVLEDLDVPDGPYGPASGLTALRELREPAALAAAPRRGPAIAALAVACAACAVAAWALWLRPQPAPEPPRVRSLTFSGRDWAPAVSPDGSLVVFTSDRDGTSRIWLKQLGGGGEVPLTDGPDDIARFSPDGRQVLFAHDEGNRRDLYRVPVVGGPPRKVVTDAVEGDWSPDGQRVVFLRADHDQGNTLQRVLVASVQSGEERQLQTASNVLWYGLRWSPDGKRIAVNEAALSGNLASTSSVKLIDAADGSLRDLPLTDSRLPFAAVSWSPSGRRVITSQPLDLLSHMLSYPSLLLTSDVDAPHARSLAWVPSRLPRGGWGYSTTGVLDGHTLVTDESVTMAEVHEVALDGSGRPGQARVLTTGLSRDRQPAYAHDGNTIIFSSNRSGNVDLWLCDRQSGRLRQLTDDAASDWDPAYSPDGKWLLWSSDRGGNMEIWMAAADGSGARQVSRDGADAENPTMSADGAWITYASGDERKMGIWKIRPDGSDAVRLLAGPYLLPEISPDGQHVLCVSNRDLDYVVSVIRLEDGSRVDFEIVISPFERQEDVMFGRARWTPDGRGILYVGQDAQGHSGIYVQDFVPGQDTAAGRRPLAGFSQRYATESLGISPDGRSLAFAVTDEQRTIKVVDGLDLSDWR